MLTSPDFKELLSLFRKHNVRYLVVGAYAVMKYTCDCLLIICCAHFRILPHLKGLIC